MRDAALFKRWKISEALLRRAHAVLPRSGADAERFHQLEEWFFEYLDHNEHELALDMLEELGELASPPGGFWKDLIRAAENMELATRVPALHKKYGEALSRLRENEEEA